MSTSDLLKTVVKRNPKVTTRLVGDALYVFDEKRMILHTYNDLGSFIWKFLRTPKTVEQIVRRVVSVYDVADTVVQKDVMQFVIGESGSGKLFALDNHS